MATPDLLLDRQGRVLSLTFNRPEHGNTLTQGLLNALSDALDVADRDPDCRVLVLRGTNGQFCTGMDFGELTERLTRIDFGVSSGSDSGDAHYMDLLRRIASIGKVVVSAVDGQVMAGGVGFLAASDLVLATPASRFSLPEALWGLLPACVLPLLIRRIGFQDAYRLTLTTETWSADQAHTSGLVDEVDTDLDGAIRKRMVRLSRLEPETVRNLKAYFRKMWYLSDAVERTAVDEIDRLVRDPRIQENIRNFVEHKRFPWEGRS